MRGADRALSRLTTLPAQARAALMNAAAQTARDTAEAAKNAAPVRTGALRASIASFPQDTGAAVTAACDHAALVELGSLRRAARPYLLPAARDSDFASQAAQALKEVLS